jgi:GAF domain-containing protein
MRYDIIAIVASPRGVSQMRQLVKRLPAGFPAPVVCLAQCHSALPAQLAEECALPVRWVEAGERMQPANVYISPPGRTPLLVDDGSISLAPYGPESTALQPQDHFLTSIARKYGSRALCIVLGNFEGDGVRGAQAVKEAGGTLIVLDRATATYLGVAEPIVRAGAFDRILGAEEVAEALRAWFSPCGILECAELQFRLGELLDSALRSSGTRLGNVQLLDRSSELLHIVVHRGFEKPVLDRFGTISAREETACARALRFRHRVVIDDIETDPQYRPYLEAARAAGYRAVQSTPLFSAYARIAGMFSTHYPYPHQVGTDEARMLDEIAREAQPLMTRFQGERGEA